MLELTINLNRLLYSYLSPGLLSLYFSLFPPNSCIALFVSSLVATSGIEMWAAALFPIEAII